MYKYTICFIRDQSFGDDFLLLLKRNKEPNANLYNGVGGKIKPGETPMQCILRETLEETEIALPAARFGGVVTWPEELNQFSNGMYVYVADFPALTRANVHLLRGQETSEGRLQWFPTDYVLDFDSPRIVSNILYFLPAMLSGEIQPLRYHCTYNEHGALDKVEHSPLSQDVIEEATRT